IDHNEENTVDLLSSLPNDILCRIISLLPFKSAVKSSFLSTRCRNLWKITTITSRENQQNATYQGDFQFNFGKGNVQLCSVSLGGNKPRLDFSTGVSEAA
ncbi:hypothetical protein CUMW_152320, partial [Citrus unshiu]